MWYIYWITLLATCVILIIIAIKKPRSFVARCLGRLVGKLRYNNNWRWCAGLLLAVVFTISAILAGFGRPLLTTSAREAKTELLEKIDTNKIATTTSQFQRLLWGTNNTPLIFTTDPTHKSTGKKYASWWHWRIAIFCWFATLVYTPFAFADEVAAAFKSILKSLVRKQRQIRNNPAVVTTAAAAQTSKLPSFFGGHFWKLLHIEIIGEWVSEFLKLIGIKLFKK